MRIAHLCLSCFYIDGRAYQENELVRQHVTEGHEVLVVASTESHSSAGQLTYVSPSEYLGTDGARVIRLPYSEAVPKPLAPKLRIISGVYDTLESFKPDTILFHGTCGWELLTVARFARDHPAVLFYVDSHEDWYNSARTFLSREFLHKIFYRRILQRALPQIKKLLCVSTESMDFVETVYAIPRRCLEFYPLGGRPIPEQEYRERRDRTRSEFNLVSTEILLVQSGKQTQRKKLIEALKAFGENQEISLRFFIAGSLSDDIREEASKLIDHDSRIKFIGWKTSEELTDLLCAADIYLQPGTQSATMQHSLCCHCCVIIDDVPAHKIYYRDNGWLINQEQPLSKILSEICYKNLSSMQEKSNEIAREILDYKVLGKRILQ